ncbi:ring-infected erythrocyte surface antigen-like [Bufo gargarizans]|uniref:ring-infected erythrocyte surface antigen-like n=1 Tax=Bufo gargarizans TaxID=30331 RepID=UPI001CF2886C|nr:ring-infected erythrocyte surface antigen-like [Bufo gargarizans]
MGADLLVIKNQEQQEFIQRNLRQWIEDSYWIGLHHDGDGWRWVDGEHYNSGLMEEETEKKEKVEHLVEENKEDKHLEGEEKREEEEIKEDKHLEEENKETEKKEKVEHLEEEAKEDGDLEEEENLEEEGIKKVEQHLEEKKNEEGEHLEKEQVEEVKEKHLDEEEIEKTKREVKHPEKNEDKEEESEHLKEEKHHSEENRIAEELIQEAEKEFGEHCDVRWWYRVYTSQPTIRIRTISRCPTFYTMETIKEEMDGEGDERPRRRSWIPKCFRRRQPRSLSRGESCGIRFLRRLCCFSIETIE